MRLPKRATLSVGLLLLVLYSVVIVSQLQRNVAKEEGTINEIGVMATNDGYVAIAVEKSASHFKKNIKRRDSKVIEFGSKPRPILQVEAKGKLSDPAMEAPMEREVLPTFPSQNPPTNRLGKKIALPPKDVKPGQTATDKKIASSMSISSLLSFQNRTSFQQAKVKSSVDYTACCGLGHRMSKMVDANYVAKKKNLGLRITWGHCNTTEIFQHFFGPQPLSELENVTSTGLRLKISNDVPGFKKFTRDGNATNCKCPIDVIEEHSKFYESLRQRFRLKKKVQAFQKQHLADHTVIGIHVRYVWDLFLFSFCCFDRLLFIADPTGLEMERRATLLRRVVGSIILTRGSSL
jgi:hypothetical protein